jgi:acyl-coenzyme A thioesterase PaaI-like protein
MREKLLRLWNFWPPFLFTGIKIEEVSKDFRHVKVKLKLRFWNANYVGTQYGGAIFSLSDAFYMVMLMRNLGPEYTVWDKSACINYLKPGKTDLYAEFTLAEEDLEGIRQALVTQKSTLWTRKVEIKDAHGVIVAEVDRVIYIRKKLRAEK